QEHILLFQDQRLWPDRTALGPGLDASGTQTSYSVNGQSGFELRTRSHERLRLRLINGCQRNAIALQFANHDIRIMAIDSRPAEPFIARDGRVVLAAGARVDAMLDATGAPGSTSPVLLFDGAG